MTSRCERLAAGAFAGSLATIPMSAVMTLWHRRLPKSKRQPLPPTQITGAMVRGAALDDLSKRQQAALTLINHFAYGAAAGAFYGPLVSPRSPIAGVAPGIAYGLSVWAASYLGWLPAVRLHRSAALEPCERNLLMIVAHVVWGGTLGLTTELAYRAARRHEAASSPPLVSKRSVIRRALAARRIENG